MRALALALVLGSVAPGASGAVVPPSIAARNSHVIVSKSDGTVVGWGSDTAGKLGTGRPIVQPLPRKVANIPAIKQVASYSFHALALDTNGRVWSWGQNDLGQLGPRPQRSSSLPGRVLHLSDVVSIAATEVISLALRSDGTVWYWGGSDGGPVDPEPKAYPGMTGIVEISAGIRHFLARRSDGTVLGVGGNQGGQLGSGFLSLNTEGPITTPIKAVLPANVVEMVATTQGGLAKTSDGKVYEWGTSGQNAFQAGVATPRVVNGLPAATTQLVGGLSAYAVLANGTLWRWDTQSAPTQIPGFSDIRTAAVDIEESTIAAVRSDGRMLIRSVNRFGEFGDGTVGNLVDNSRVVQLSSPTNFKSVDVNWNTVLGVTVDGELWIWGGDVDGSLADGAIQSYSAPRSVAGLSNIVQVASESQSSFALAADGSVYAWGRNDVGIFGNQNGGVPSSAPIRVPIANVTAIAAGQGVAVFLKADGSVWTGNVIQRVEGLPSIRAIAGGGGHAYFVDVAGVLYTMGNNAFGQVGDGTTTRRDTPVRVSAIPDPVLQVAAEFNRVLALTTKGEVWAWGLNNVGILGSLTPVQTLTPQRVPGLAGVVEVALGVSNVHLARLSDGTVKSWGMPSAALGRDTSDTAPSFIPARVEEIDSVIAIAAGQRGSFAIRTDGTVWGWGENYASNLGPSVGDGTVVMRSRPVLVLRENGGGNLDTKDWFLDAKPEVPDKIIPPGKIPKILPLTKSISGASLLNVDAQVSVRISDQSKNPGLYVVGLVPPEFLNQVKLAPGSIAFDKSRAKAGQLVLVNLTPAGWTIASGQLQAITAGVTNGFLGATNLLTNINPAQIPGARFCIGYGENATDMLNTGTIREFLAIEGASASGLGLPCLLSGVYVDGPRTSQQGNAVPLRAVVVGQSPTGSVWFRDRFSDISSPLAITSRNSAVSDVSMSYAPPAPGDYAFDAHYGGDALNAAVSSEISLRHVVSAPPPQPGQTTTRIDVSVSSEIGTEVRFTAVVSGNRPTGMVQFKRGAANEGTAVPVLNDQAVLSVVGLGIGDYNFTASYSGDGSNQASTSAAYSHQVLDVATSAVALGSSANPASLGNAVTLTATVTGINPTGTVTLREGTVATGNAVALVNGQATFTLPSLTAGIHVFNVDYGGDAANPKATSNPVFQQVSLILPSTLSMSVTKSGTGAGTVVSSPIGIDCGATCSASFNSGSAVTLSASASTGSSFAGWSGGGCSGTGGCIVTMSAATTVTATFTANVGTFALTVSKTGSGAGTVTSSPAGIDCGSTCVANFNSGASVTLTATASSGLTFAGWSGGGCSGTGTCTVTMSAANSVWATFLNFTGTLKTRYRLYSPGTFEHLYTTDFNEYSVLPMCCAWIAEGAIYRLFGGAGSYGGVAAVPYYRLYNPFSHQHHWTTDFGEFSFLPTVGWIQEGVDGQILPTQATGTLPLYRLYLNAAGGLHLWTIDPNERAYLIANAGWVDEGIAGYVIPLP